MQGSHSLHEALGSQFSGLWLETLKSNIYEGQRIRNPWKCGMEMDSCIREIVKIPFIHKTACWRWLVILRRVSTTDATLLSTRIREMSADCAVCQAPGRGILNSSVDHVPSLPTVCTGRGVPLLVLHYTEAP